MAIFETMVLVTWLAGMAVVYICDWVEQAIS